MAGCECVFHTATPVKFGGADGKSEIYEPAMESTKEVLAAVAKAGCVKTFVLTSSMSAVAPQPEPPVKTEEHWSDDAAQEAKGNWYGCTKTRQEKLVDETLKGSGVRFVAINPTGVFGPMLGPTVNKTMGWVANMAKGPKDGKANNDSMSFVDVRDCAAMHIAGFEKPYAAGRYMCIAGTATERKTDGGAVVYASTHWNDVTLPAPLEPTSRLAPPPFHRRSHPAAGRSMQSSRSSTLQCLPSSLATALWRLPRRST